MKTYRYNISGISIALIGSIQDTPLWSARITHLPMTPQKRAYFQNVLTKFRRRAFPCHQAVYFEAFPPGFEVQLFATFSSENYQCLHRHLFKFMISCREVMHNDNFSLRLFSLPEWSIIGLVHGFSAIKYTFLGHLIEIVIHEFMRLGMEPYDPQNTNPLRQPP